MQGMGEYPFTEVGYADIQLALTEWYYFETWQHLEEWRRGFVIGIAGVIL